MSHGRLGGVLDHLRRTALRHDAAGVSDAQLLDCFLSRRDEAAFEALVRRHGPMVLGVCRRVLGNEQDAEDAFQAAFLVLVRKAASIQPRDLVGHWLYGVAYRTALEARGILARRRAKERQVSTMPEPPAPQITSDSDVRPVLDEELHRLPEKYRAAIVLCELEGRSRREAAGLLRIPEGTLSSRLATARRMLAGRLTRRGFGVSAAALAALFAHQASATIPAPLLTQTVRAATLFAVGAGATAALSTNVVLVTEGVLKAMFLTKLKTVTAVCALMVVLGGGIGLVGHATSADPADGDKAGQVKSKDAKKTGTAGAVEAIPNKEVEKKLNAKISVKFQDTNFEDALVELRENTGINIIVDKRALAEAGLNLNIPVTLHLQGVSRKTVLKHILREAGLTYSIDDGILIVTTPQADKLVRRVYPVQDLVIQFMPEVMENGERAVPDLVRVILKTVEPQSWSEAGGRGSVEYFHDGRSIVVTQTSEIQDEIRELLEELRKCRKEQKLDEQPAA
jgi:RNA polymerase sigma-70 factor (ECF subfamily)